MLSRLWPLGPQRYTTPVSYSLFPNYRAKTVRDGLAVGNEHRPSPPALAIQAQQLPQNDEHAQQHETAQGTENKTEEAVHAAENGQAHEVPDRGANPRSEEQDEHHENDPRRPGPDLRPRQQAAQVGRDQIREMPRDEQRDDPRHKCD